MEEVAYIKSKSRHATGTVVFVLILAGIFIHTPSFSQILSLEMRGGIGLPLLDAVSISAQNDGRPGYSWGFAWSSKSENRKFERYLDLSNITSPKYNEDRRWNPGYYAQETRVSVISLNYLLGESFQKNKWCFGYSFGGGVSIASETIDGYRKTELFSINGAVTFRSSYNLSERWSVFITPRITIYPIT